MIDRVPFDEQLVYSETMGQSVPNDMYPKSIPLPRVTLYSKPDCHLCEIAKERIANVRRSTAFELDTVDITSDPVLYARYQERIPVVYLEGKEVFAYRISEKILTQKLREMTPRQSFWTRFWSRS